METLKVDARVPRGTNHPIVAGQIHQKYRSTTRGGPELPLITLVAITT
jgi:hypothetical protein